MVLDDRAANQAKETTASPSPEPTPIAVAVVQDSGRVLIGRRPASALLGGYWEFPGGKVAPGETPQEAAARECREETGLNVRIGRCYLEVPYRYEHGPVRLQFFAATAADPARSPSEPFRWVPLSDLPRYPFPPANAPVLAILGKREPPEGGSC